jgi:hypothetical protein
MSAQRRLRLLRLRAIEHRIAAAGLARADAALGTVIAVEARVDRLRQSVTPPPGPTSGRVLQSLAELGARLDRARDGLLTSRLDADAERCQRDADRNAAHRAEQSVGRLHAAAHAEEAILRESRADAARIWRKRKGAPSC